MNNIKKEKNQIQVKELDIILEVSCWKLDI